MPDPSVPLLLQQIVINPVFLIQVSVNIHLTYVVEEVEIKIFHLTFFQLFLKDLFHFVHI